MDTESEARKRARKMLALVVVLIVAIGLVSVFIVVRTINLSKPHPYSVALIYFKTGVAESNATALVEHYDCAVLSVTNESGRLVIEVKGPGERINALGTDERVERVEFAVE